MYEEELGRLIRNQRTSRGISARQLSQQIGLSPSYISQVERGLIKKPPYDIAHRIGQILDIPDDVLFFFGVTPQDSELSPVYGPDPSDDEILIQLKHDKSQLLSSIGRVCKSDPYTAYTLFSYLNQFLSSPCDREFLRDLLDRCRWFETPASRQRLLELIDAEVEALLPNQHSDK